MKYSAFAVFAALALASTPALAHRHHDNDRAHSARFLNKDMATADRALKERDDTLRRSMAMTRVGAVERQDIAQQRREIRDLRDRLQDGHIIDHYTLYRALGGSSHPIYFDSDLS
jgi:hypothetical protein